MYRPMQLIQRTKLASKVTGDEPASQASEASQPASQPTNHQPASYSTSHQQSVSHWADNQSSNRPTKQGVSQPSNERRNERTNEPANEPASQPTNQPPTRPPPHTTRHQPARLPFRLEHSMSKLRMRIGATFCHSPSGGWETNLFQATSTSSWERETGEGPAEAGEEGSRRRQVPAGREIQLQPTTSVSIMNLAGEIV